MTDSLRAMDRASTPVPDSSRSSGSRIFTPLIPIQIASIYHGPLPARLALCTPDTKAAILAVAADLNLLEVFRDFGRRPVRREHEDFFGRLSVE